MYIYIKRIKFGFMEFLKNRILPTKLIIYFIFLPIILMAETTEYLIITSATLKEAADSLVALHSDYVNDASQLNTEVILVEDGTSASEIRGIIQDIILTNDNFQYLLLLGDETILPPIYKDHNPSDDFYSTIVETSGTPLLATGRIPVNNLSDALIVTEKIME